MDREHTPANTPYPLSTQGSCVASVKMTMEWECWQLTVGSSRLPFPCTTGWCLCWVSRAITHPGWLRPAAVTQLLTIPASLSVWSSLSAEIILNIRAPAQSLRQRVVERCCTTLLEADLFWCAWLRNMSGMDKKLWSCQNYHSTLFSWEKPCPAVLRLYFICTHATSYATIYVDISMHMVYTAQCIVPCNSAPIAVRVFPHDLPVSLLFDPLLPPSLFPLFLSPSPLPSSSLPSPPPFLAPSFNNSAVHRCDGDNCGEVWPGNTQCPPGLSLLHPGIIAAEQRTIRPLDINDTFHSTHKVAPVAARSLDRALRLEPDIVSARTEAA